MILSSEQQHAIHAGAFHRAWRLIELPVGPQPLPRWVKDLHVEWMDGYGNPPGMAIKVTHNIGTWPGQRFAKEGSRYLATHTDGRAVTHYHNGPIKLVKMTRRVRTGRTEWRDEEYEAYATTQQEGYAGRHYSVTLGGKHELRGQEVILRGPWHGGPPRGYTAVTTVDMSSDYIQRNIRDAAQSKRWRRPWWKQTGCFGVEIRDDVLIAIFARFQPHLRLAWVEYKTFTSLEPMKPEWDCPKDFWREKQRSAAA